MAPVPEPPTPQVQELGFSISHQKVELDLDLPSRSLWGRTEITINPHSTELKSVRLNCRQCELKRVTVNGKPSAGATYEDPYRKTTLPWRAGPHQYHMLHQRVEAQLKNPPEEELTVIFPKSLRIGELDPFSEEAQSLLLSRSVGSGKGDTSANSIDLATNPRTAIEQAARFTPIQVNIEYVVKNIRDGMQFVGWEEGDLRYPHAYTTNSLSPGAACCLFPCTDDPAARCTWEISIKCQKTVGDALRSLRPQPETNGMSGLSDSLKADPTSKESIHYQGNFSDEDKALDLVVLCTGDTTDEVGTVRCLVHSANLYRCLILTNLRREPHRSYVQILYQRSTSASLSDHLSMSIWRTFARLKRMTGSAKTPSQYMAIACLVGLMTSRIHVCTWQK